MISNTPEALFARSSTKPNVMQGSLPQLLTRSLAALGLALTLPGLAAAQGCTDPANVHEFTFDGSRYQVVQEQRSWGSAAGCAADRGAHLVHINSQAEQDRVLNEIQNGAGVSANYTSVQDGGGAAYVWIGGTDRQQEGTWIWDGDADGSGANFWNGQGEAGSGDGMPVGGAFSVWGSDGSGTPQEPDDFDSGQDGAAIALSSWPNGFTGQWNDIKVSNTLYYVIENENVSTGDRPEQQEGIQVHHNAQAQQLTVEADLSAGVQGYAILDVQGRTLVRNQTIGQAADRWQVRLPSTARGLYLLRVLDEKGNAYTDKFFLQ